MQQIDLSSRTCTPLAVEAEMGKGMGKGEVKGVLAGPMENVEG